MYNDFYNLKEKPFNLTPSSRFLYLGETHKEALALLSYSIAERKGFTLLTGEVGTGKTTMIQSFLANLDKSIQHVYLSNPLMSPKDFIDYLGYSIFQKKVHFPSKAEFLIEFEGFLKKCLQHQKNFVLIIDEAHKLSFELLEEIRLLSNMETANEKLINIFLAGQPELNEKLSKPECRALLQRINTRYHIKPLELNGTHNYILKRLQMAGAEDGHKIFNKNVIKAIHLYSRGYPRMINILADNVLLLGYSNGTKKIRPSMVQDCYEDLQLNGSFPKSPPPEPKRTESGKEKNLQISNNWKWATAFFLLIAIFAVAIIQYGEHIPWQLSDFAPFKHESQPESTYMEQVQTKEKIVQKVQKVIKKDPLDIKQEAIGVTAEAKIDEPKTIPLEVKQASIGVTEETKIDDLKIIPSGKFNESENRAYNKDEGLGGTAVVVKKGDTLIKLAIDVYSRSDKDILNLIHKQNPGIRDLNIIEVGQEIIFPPLSRLNHGPTFTVHIASFKPFESARNMFQELLTEGHEAYVIPIYNTQAGKVFRITLGNFEDQQQAENYSKEILKNNISDYAKVIQLEIR